MLAFVCVSWLLLAAQSLAHNVLLQPHGKVCFFEDKKNGDTLEITFQVGTRDPTSKAQLECDFYFMGPGGRRLYEVNRVTNGQPKIEIKETGRHQFCFSNEYSSDSSKDVTFHLSSVGAAENNDLKATHQTLDGNIKLLDRLVRDVQNEQSYIVIRERVHRNTAESTNSRVKWWSLLQLAIIGGNSAFQVFFLMRFFEVKSNV